MPDEGKICVGQFAGAHGVRGLVKLRSFTEDPDAIFSYTPLTSGERRFSISKRSASGQYFVVSVEGIGDKEAADQLRGDKLYVPHSLLPETRQNEFYEADLVGLTAVDTTGKTYGKVLAVFDYGGGPFLEIGTSKKDSFMLPFKTAFIPEVHVNEGWVLVVVPENWL
jgi:16S rRNA processing protein RimM